MIYLGVEPRGIEPRSKDFQSSAYTKSAKVPIKAERKGFEPLYRNKTINGFQDRRIQPLCHPSKYTVAGGGLEPPTFRLWA